MNPNETMTQSDAELRRSSNAETVRDRVDTVARDEDLQNMATISAQIMTQPSLVTDIIQGITSSKRGQNLIIFVFVLNMIATGLVGFGVAYYYPVPTFQCRDQSSLPWLSCIEDVYCQKVELDPTLGRYDPDVFKTWTYEYKLYCDRSYLRNVSSFIFCDFHRSQRISGLGTVGGGLDIAS